MKSKTQLKEDKMMAWLLLGYSILLMFFCSSFSPIYGFNELADINVYHTIGKAMMDGKVLYKDIFDHKGPFVFLLYGFASLFPGKYFIGAFLFETAFLFISLWFAYKIACLYLGRGYSFLCALLFSVFPLLYNGQGGSAEEVALPFFMISFYFLFKYLKDGGVHDPFWMLIHGIMLTFVFLIKLNLTAFWIFIPALFIYFLLKKEYFLILRNLITLFLGVFLAGAPTFCYFYFTDSLYDLYHSYIDFNLLYGADVFNSDVVEMKAGDCLRYDGIFAALVMLISFGFSFTRGYIKSWGLRLILILTFFATFAAILFSPFFFEYYYIPLTVFSILGVILVVRYIEKWIEMKHLSMVYKVGAVLSILLIVGLGLNKYESFTAYSKIDFIKSFANEIEKEPREDQTLLSLGLDYGVCVFTEAGIIPNVKYFFTPNIKKEVYPAISDAQRAYIESKALNFVIVRDRYRYYDTLLPFLMENYEVVKTYPMDDQTYYLYKRK